MEKLYGNLYSMCSAAALLKMATLKEIKLAWHEWAMYGWNE